MLVILVVIIAVVFILYESLKGGTATANQAAVTPSGVYLPTLPDNGNSPLDIGGPTLISYDESTWPSGDRFWNVCRAIARAEGANIEGSNPDRLNNPGDISDGSAIYGFENHSGSKVTKFPDKETGWKWLYQKINNIVQGNSDVYSPSMTWTQLSQKYAGNWQAWVNNVTGSLNVDPDSTIGDYFS